MNILKDKRILVADDEPDILRTVEQVLDMCRVDTAADFHTAEDLLEKNTYDAAILDIMGVKGYELLEITKKMKIPTLMLTAHALSPDNFVKSIEGGARAYIPKDKLSESDTFLRDILEATETGDEGGHRWYKKLEKFFEKSFGTQWEKETDPEFWKKYFYI